LSMKPSSSSSSTFMTLIQQRHRPGRDGKQAIFGQRCESI
jgi:hypothetical protein